MAERRPSRRRGASLLIAALTAAPAQAGGAAPWGFHAQLLEPLHKGDTSLIVSDCSHAFVGQRLRMGQGGVGEEEAEVLSLRCPAPGLPPSALKKAEALAAAAGPDPCDLAALGWKSPDGRDGAAADVDTVLGAEARAKLPAHCREMLEAAARVPGLEDSYRKASKHATQLMALQPEAATLAAGSGAKRVPGVVTLRFATLYAHEVGDSVHGYGQAHDKVELASKLCPGGATLCAGRGVCDSVKGACDCDAGWGGAGCEEALCAGGCGAGTCGNGTCLCTSGFTGVRCEVQLAAQAQCKGGCNGHGTCLGGTCACDEHYHGEACLLLQMPPRLELASSCPDSCNGHGSCNGDGTCDCFAGASGPSCGNYCPHNCSTNGRCTTQFQCVCALGFAGDSCQYQCDDRCSSHGEGELSDNGRECVCRCFEGYTGDTCKFRTKQSLSDAMLGGMYAYYPQFVLCFYGACFLFGFCTLGYVVNRCNGKFGTSAIPMWDYYAKKWRNAPLFEPVLHSRPKVPMP